MVSNPILNKYLNDLNGEHPYWSDKYDAVMDWLDNATERDEYCRERGYTNSTLDEARAALSNLRDNAGVNEWVRIIRHLHETEGLFPELGVDTTPPSA